MARLRRASPVSHGVEDLRNHQVSTVPHDASPTKSTALAHNRQSPRKQTRRLNYRLPESDDTSSSDHDTDSHVLVPKTTGREVKGRKQVRLAPLKSASLVNMQSDLTLAPSLYPGPNETSQQIHSARRAEKPAVQSGLHSSLDLYSKKAAITTKENAISASDSDSDDSSFALPSPNTFITRNRKPLYPRSGPLSDSEDIVNVFESLQIADVEETSPERKPRTELFRDLTKKTRSISRSSSNSSYSNSTNLAHSPPSHRQYDEPSRLTRPHTPPAISPSKSRLATPTKKAARVPTPPSRQSLDAFWSPGRVNEWNEQYSPQKVIKSPTKNRFLQLDISDSATTSPRKCESSARRTKAELTARREFELRKKPLAEEFLAELDATITDGKLQELSASTGGIRITWSKTLNSTAGRANWRRETTKSRKSDGTPSIEHKHFATIELAEKVIDDESRLLNVLAHEFCHLANFMVSGIKTRPHGAEFKAWGRKCTAAFGGRGIEVTTKHSYQIEYKYIWACSSEECGAEFKRHSKSIDTSRQTCGRCRARLIQVKPVPRKGAGDNGQLITGYAAFVKLHFASIKRAMPGANHKDVMEAVGQRYRAEKQGTVAQAPSAEASVGDVSALDGVTRDLEGVTLDD